MTEYIVTTCVLHGEKVTADLESAEHYQKVVRDEWRDIMDKAEQYGEERGDAEHDYQYHDDGSDCWVCCSLMETPQLPFPGVKGDTSVQFEDGE